MMMQEDLFWFAIDEALEMVLIFEESGRILFANALAKERLEYGEELCGTYIWDIFPNQFQNSDNGVESELGFNLDIQEMLAYRKNRTCFAVQARVLADSDVTGHYVCMAEDVSNEQFLEKAITQVKQEAADAMKVKSEFVANVTHELRTPVNGILGNTKELLEHETDERKLRKLQLIEHGCRDMHNIINNILDFSKLEAGKFLLEPQKFNFRNMIDYVKSNHQNRIIEKGLEFFVTISPTVPECIVADELRIVQILNNLLSNATKFTTVGKIALEVVKTAQEKNRAELFFFVVDTGIGIDTADQDKLFKSFSQVDASISRKFGGTGLGLNISKQLVELMGGKIGVQSQKNKGSTFSFSIWVELPEDELENRQSETKAAIAAILQSAQGNQDDDDTWEYGTKENIAEIQKRLSKLILSIEMENWEKAEMFVDGIKQLTENAPREIKNIVLKIKMAVQKENYEKAMTAYDTFQKML